MADNFATAMMRKGDDVERLNRLAGSLEDRKSYFTESLGHLIYAGSDEGLWKRLKILMTIRNVLAHDAGRYEKSVHRPKLRGWIADGELCGVKLVTPEDHGSPIQLEGYIAFSDEYLWSALADAKALLEDLIARWEYL